MLTGGPAGARLDAHTSTASPPGVDASEAASPEVVNLQEQARSRTWPLLRAVLKRAPLLLRIVSCAGTETGHTERV